MRAREFISESLKTSNPCWDGYEPIGTKKKAGKTVPNCVPKKGVSEVAKLKLSKDPDAYGTDIIDRGTPERVVTLPINQLTGFEPMDKMKSPESMRVVKGMVQDLRAGKELPPVLVRRLGHSKYQILDGHHRLTAYLIVGMKKIPARIISKVNISGDISEDAPSLLKAEMPIVRHIEQELAQHGYEKGSDEWKQMFNHALAYYRKFGYPSDISEDWQKTNKQDKTDGMSKKAVKAYRKEHPGSKLKTAVTTKPSKLKKGSKDSNRRKSFCARSNGQRKMHNIDCSATPDKPICKARKRWNCE